MGKLGKKARKFAKKNLQAVLRQRRKNKSFFKKRSSSKNEQNDVEDEVDNKLQRFNGRNADLEDIENASLDAVFAEDESDVVADASESDGYLSEDLSIPVLGESGNGNISEDDIGLSILSQQNKKIHEELAMQKKKLDRLRKKDPDFNRFLESYSSIETSENDEMDSDEDERSNQGVQLTNKDDPANNVGKVLTAPVINSLCEVIKQNCSESTLISLFNAYRAACHYGTESVGYRIQNSETFLNILMFVLCEADPIFRRLLQISSSNCKKEAISELKDTSKWKNVKPLVKSYLRSSLYLLNQLTDSSILAFCLTRLRVSLIFFAAFPSLLPRLIKTTVHLWATGGGVLSSASFLIIRDVASMFSSDCFDSCLAKSFLAYNAQCRVPEIVDGNHINFLRNSFVELCSLDVHKSSAKALASIRQLAKILQWGLRTKKKEAVKKICSVEYVNCVDLWVLFISTNISDYDLHPLFFTAIQLINGMAYMFPGPRYFPLRLKCIQWLNNLSSSSGIFVPVASFVLDVLEYKIVKEGGKPGPPINFSSVLKLPKHCLKSQAFQEECLFSAIEQLSMHFAQWSYHISFPELATIPLICLRKFHDSTTNEGLRRVVKRLIDQVEQNVNFVQKKRDEVAFSPNDHQSVDSFLQLEKSSLNASFTQYYRSILEKAPLRILHKNEKTSLQHLKKSQRKQQTASK